MREFALDFLNNAVNISIWITSVTTFGVAIGGLLIVWAWAIKKLMLFFKFHHIFMQFTMEYYRKKRKGESE